MAEIPGFVLDGTVAGRWFSKDEPMVTEAVSVREDFEHGRIRLFAPRLINIEFSSILSKAIHRPDRPQRPSLSQGWALVGDFLSCGVEIAENEPLLLPAYLLADRYSCSVYDGLYMALAEHLNVPYLHADGRLRRSLRGRFPLELWLENYQPKT